MSTYCGKCNAPFRTDERGRPIHNACADSPVRLGVTAFNVEPMEENGDEFYVLTLHHGLGRSTRLDLDAADLRELSAMLLAAIPSEPPTAVLIDWREPEGLDDMLAGYVECALWSSDVEGDGTAFDQNYGADDIASESLAAMRAECSAFLRDNEVDLMSTGASYEQHGHDFWLTRNHHGAGFWDRGYGPTGDRLTEACRPYGTSDLYIGDDGKVHVE